jgi:hypothetical protein
MTRPFAELSPLDRIVDKAAEMSELLSFGRLNVDGQSVVLQLAWRVAKAGSRDVEAFFDGMSRYPYTGGSRAIYDNARQVGDLVALPGGSVDRADIIHVAELAGLLRQQRQLFPKRELLAAAAMGLNGLTWASVGHAIVFDDARWYSSRRRVSKIRGNRGTYASLRSHRSRLSVRPRLHRRSAYR